MGFERLAPQVVRHSDGYIVQIADREHVEYIDGDQMAEIFADLDGPVVRLHAQWVTWKRPTDRQPSKDEQAQILERACEGMVAMGDLCEVIDEAAD